MSVFVTILSFFSVGILARYFLSPPQGWTDALNFFVINIAFPAVILLIVPQMQLTIDVFVPFLSYWLLIPLVWCFSKCLTHFFSWSKDIECVFFVLCICGNTAFLGIPMMQAFIEKEAVAYGLLYDQFGSFLGLSTVVAFVIARYQSADAGFNIKKLAFKVITFTPFAVLLVSLLLPIENMIKPFSSFLVLLGQLVVPATMMVVGLQFTIKIERNYYLPLATILFTKMLLLPLMVWSILNLTAADVVITTAVVFQTAAAPMITAAALLISARVAVPLVGSTLGLGTILSFISLPIWALFLA